MLENLNGYEIMLVSGSPRRRELLSQMGLEFETGRSSVEETAPEGLGRYELAMYLAQQKACHPMPEMKGNSLVIAADTIVWLDGQCLGKPHDEQEAARMLHTLGGKVHYVVTGVVVRTQREMHRFYAETAVTFADLSDEEINYYIAHYHPMDKAGAYGIQEWIGMIGVKEIDGSYYNVMGLPVRKLYEVLKTICPRQ